VSRLPDLRRPRRCPASRRRPGAARLLPVGLQRLQRDRIAEGEQAVMAALMLVAAFHMVVFAFVAVGLVRR
jgi:hypothetical protein